MDFQELRRGIKYYSAKKFVESSNILGNIIFSLNESEVINLIPEIGIIPEDIEHDSSEEKLYTKTSDILFAKALQCMNFEVNVLRERADAADIIARSKYHSYSLVGDAKAFRLSRTAKNAKDFKVDSMVNWKGSEDFSVLSCPYFQYPSKSSQIYKEALNGNVMLFSWEWLYILLNEGIKESEYLSLHDVWDQSHIIASTTMLGNQKECFIQQQNVNICNLLNITEEKFCKYFEQLRNVLTSRGLSEIKFYEQEIQRVMSLSREQAIGELLTYKKFDSKIHTIRQFINKISSRN